MANHPHRFEPKEYRGRRSYFVTLCAHGNEPLFSDAATARLVIDQLFRSAANRGFSVTAYCVMRDHVHAVVSGSQEDSDFIKWINLWRQLSGYEFKRLTGRLL
jgi:REP element-mobilizing transposase RayT